MSNLDTKPRASVAGGLRDVSPAPAHQLLPGRPVTLGESTVVRRLLPTLGRRMVGAWCFIDHYGPDEIAGAPGMQVAPHPHIGLQTVSWLLAGEVLHRDSLGSVATLRPGQLGLMTAGAGIAHSEQSAPDHSPLLHGAQLWVALPAPSREADPRFALHPELPVIDDGPLHATVVLGDLAGARSPGTTHSPLIGADVSLAAGAKAEVPLEPEFEHATLVATGTVEVDGDTLSPGALLYLGCGRSRLALHAGPSDARLLLFGGEPFEERIVMWWNFVAGSGEEIAAARERWAGGDFGPVAGYAGESVPAPPLPPGTLKPRGRER